MKNSIILDTHERGYCLKADFSFGELVLPMGGVWNARKWCWVLPPTAQIDRLLSVPNLTVSSSAAGKFSRSTLLRSLQSAQDADISYGDGIDPYQRVGVKFLATAGRAILADAVGLGKSAQAIRAANEVGARKVLVITKKSLIYNWQTQVDLWNARQDVQFDITNYEQAVRRLGEFITAKYDVLVLDEAHYAKNRRADRSKAVYKLAQTIPCVWLLTGTPVLNRPDELWMLLHIIDRKRFSSYWDFVETFCETALNPWSGSKQAVGLKANMRSALADELSTLLLRRTRNAVRLPPITRETLYVELHGEQKAMYDKMLREFYVIIENEGVLHAPTVLAQFTRLRQIACTPALIGGPDKSAKTDAIVDAVNSVADDHKILLFSTFAEYARNLAQKLKRHNPVLITGDMSAKQRAASERMFSENQECRVLAGTTGAMGEGLNLQTASVIIHANKDWVPMRVEQPEGRAHRRGQSRAVHVMSFVATRTVDTYVEHVLRDKNNTIRAVDVIARMYAGRKED